MAATRPSLEYLVTSSRQSLESYELSRLNQASNLRKELRDVVEEWVETEVDARFARWILECRRTEATPSDAVLPALLERAAFAQLELPFESRSHSEVIGHDSREVRALQEAPANPARQNQLSAPATNTPGVWQPSCLPARSSATRAATQVHENPPPGLDLRNSLLALMPDDVRGLLRAAEQLAQQKATKLGSRRDPGEGLTLPGAGSAKTETMSLPTSPNLRAATVQTRYQNKTKRLRRICTNAQQNIEADRQPVELDPAPPTRSPSPMPTTHNFAIAPTW
jgi:hypothetical protein